MFVPNIKFPEKIIDTNLSKELTADKIKLWLDDLAYINNPRGQKLVFNTLRKLNRLNISPLDRLKVMLQFKVAIRHILQESTQKHSILNLAVSAKDKKTASFVESLLFETSLAYKIIVHEISSDRKLLKNQLNKALAEAIYQALTFDSQILVQRYQLYLNAPENLWRDINQLYLMAEKLGIEAIPSGSSKASSIAHQYKRIAILSLSDPHHFMQCEVPNIYQLLDEWVAHCQISTDKTVPKGQAYVVDLISGQKPHLYSKKTDIHLKEQRWIISQKLQNFMQTYVTNFKRIKLHQKSSFEYRKQRDMLSRLNHNLAYSDTRKEKRMIQDQQIEIVFGLSSAHHCIAGKYQSDTEKSMPGDNITAFKKNPFISQEQLLNDRQTLLDAAKPIAQLLENSIHQNTQYTKEHWTQHNVSSKGMMLVSETKNTVSARVGMIVAYKTTEKNTRCQFAVVRWMRVRSNSITIGIMKIADQANPVSVQAKSGIGHGSDFQQALLINNPQGTPELLLPAGIYDLGTQLSVWKNKKLYFIEISEMCMSSNSFTSVKYKRIHKDNGSKQKLVKKNSNSGRYSKQLNHYLNQLLAC